MANISNKMNNSKIKLKLTSDRNFISNDDIFQELVDQIESAEAQNSLDGTTNNSENGDSSSNPAEITNNSLNRKHKRTYKNNEFYEVQIPRMTLDDFRYHFRMSRNCFQSIMTRVANKIRLFSMEKKFLFTIWMLSTRESFASVGSRFSFSKGQSHQYFCDIIDGLIVLFKEYVAWPNENKLLLIEQGFKPKTGAYVPGIIGAISSCHLLIKKPARYSIYCNPRETHSVVLQAVCDHQQIFTDVYVGAPGCLNAERVYNNSPLSKAITTLIPDDYHIVGNISFPLNQNLVVPFPDQGILTETQKLFNNCLTEANSTVEQAFLLLLARFRRLTYLDTGKPEMANRIICSCIILHNHILMTDLDDDPSIFLQECPELYLNIDPDGVIASDDDPNGLVMRNYLMSLLNFV